MKENFLKFKWSTIILGFLIISNNCLTASDGEKFDDSTLPSSIQTSSSFKGTNQIIDEDKESWDPPSILVFQSPPNSNETEGTLARSTSASIELNPPEEGESIVGFPALDENSQALSSSSQILLPPIVHRSDGSSPDDTIE